MEVRGHTRRWALPSPTETHGETSDASPLVERVLRARGITGDAAVAFMQPKLNDLHDPSAMPGLERAAERITEALKNREPIAIYGDYDVDGMTATAILVRTIRGLRPDADVRTYVPHRVDEGYGLNAAALDSLAADGARVVVTVDCGITAVDEAVRARDLGLDLIITDHHNPREDGVRPDAFALVHPRTPAEGEPPYPFTELCGAAVAFKLAWRLVTLHCRGKADAPRRDLLVRLLALVALGTVADVVPLVGENRVLCRHGLSMMKHLEIPGLRALVAASGLDHERIDTERVGFSLAPRLNACGRMGHASEAIELLTTDDARRAMEIAQKFSRMNEQRRTTERRILAEAEAAADECGMTGDTRRAIVLAGEGWHPGVIGIVCSRLVDRYARPTLLLTRREDGSLTGSGRSIDGFSLHAALTACADHLISFGGHDAAAGLRLTEDALPAFTDAFTTHVNERLAPDDCVHTATCDATAELSELSPTVVRSLEALAPFGRANPRVRLLLKGVRLAQSPRPFGSDGSHLKLRVEDRAAGVAADIVAWRWATHAPTLRAGDHIDAIVTPKISSYSGLVEPELVDLRSVQNDSGEAVVTSPPIKRLAVRG